MNYDIRQQLEELQKHYFLAIDEAFKAKTVLGEANFEEMRQDLMNRYRIERDQLKEQAKIPDKNINFETTLKIYELTPHRRGFLWIFKNEARKLKEREVSAENRMELDARTDDVEQLEEKIYGTPETHEEQPKKFSFFKRLFKRRDQLKQLKDTLQTNDEAAPHEDNLQLVNTISESAGKLKACTKFRKIANESTYKRKDQSEEITSELPAAVANIQSGAEQQPAACTAPAPPMEEPKLKGKPKKVTKPTAEPPAPTACTAPAPQLPGQIAMDELTNK